MAFITIPNSFTASTPAVAGEVNANFEAIATGLANGTMDLNIASLVVSGYTVNGHRWQYTDTWAGETSKSYVVDGSVVPARGSVTNSKYTYWLFFNETDGTQEFILPTFPTASQVVVTAIEPLTGTFTVKGIE